MADLLDEKTKYIDLLNRIQKKCSSYEGLLLIKKQYFTNNIFYYIACIFFHFIHLISISGNYSGYSGQTMSSNIRINRIKSFQEYLKLLTCYNLVEQWNFSFLVYGIIIAIILILYIIRIIENLYILKSMNNYKKTNKWPLPNKFLIITDHFIFLFFPYIVEYLSFSYYMYFFPEKFIIKINDKDTISLFILIIINTILIVLLNIDNYIAIISCNKIFTTSLFDAYSHIYKNKINKTNYKISYKCSNFTIYVLIFFQNLIVFSSLDKFINRLYIRIFKIIISLIILFGILILLIGKRNEFNFFNFINAFINVLLFLCFYSIIFDFIIYIFTYRISSILDEIIYTILKLIFSYMTYLLLNLRKIHCFRTDIINILFQEKNNRKENNITNCFYYLHQKMMNIKEYNDLNSALLLIKMLNEHSNKCNKVICNCKIFNNLMNGENNINNEELKNKISEFIKQINYLFESTFVEIDFYKDYDLTILLAEHFCHLKDNPIMAFSIINTLILKQRNRFSKIQLISLYELCQKYIYFLSIKILNEIDIAFKHNNNVNKISNKKKEDEFRKDYNNLKLSYKIKRAICDYIDNMIKILKYKIIFEDSLVFQYDENNENIISVKINFLKENIRIDNLYNDSKYNKERNNNNSLNIKNSNTNLDFIIYLLKKNQSCYRTIINSINIIDIKTGIPIFMTFKYFLFFDIFGNGKIPEEIVNKLYSCLITHSSSYNSIITNKEYSILRKRYNEENNKIDSKIYSIFEFKKDLRTKYFTEDGALKLGYNQKDIINEKIDILMPKEFCRSHQNTVKRLIIDKQIRYIVSKQTFFFNRNLNTIYSAYFELVIIYNISKYLGVMLRGNFHFENEYRFMLNNNYELMANSKNFEDEYYLNQKIFRTYNINFLDILNFKPEKMNIKLAKELKKIQYQKFIRQIKTEEYFIQQLYTHPEDKNAGILSSNYFNISKNKILSSLSSSETIINRCDTKENDNEEKNLIQKENTKNPLIDLFGNNGNEVVHKTFNIIVNKAQFIQNLAKELIKIPDNDLMMENDINNYNLIISSKKLISKLQTKKELLNDYIKITIKFSFYYDKPFYFITIDDEKKLYLKISKTIHFENNKKKINIKLPTPFKNSKKKIPYNKNSNKLSRNKLTNNKNIVTPKEINNDNLIENSYEKNDFYDKVNHYRKKINKAKFITIIEIILSIIIICILIIYILIVKHEGTLIAVQEKILISYCLIYNIRDILLNINSELLQIFMDYYGFINNTLSNEKNYQNVINNLTTSFKDYYHSFNNYYIDYNLDIDHDIDILYKEKKFKVLKGFWNEIEYNSQFSTEIDFIIYEFFRIDITNKNSEEMKADLKNFPYFKDRSESKEKVNTIFIRLLYYLLNNYEFVYRELFEEIDGEIYNTYKEYSKSNIKIYILLEILGIILYIIFCITVNIYLYFSNEIIIKNIIFLFLDFNEQYYDKNRINNNLISLKLYEFQQLINDFDIQKFENYSKNLENINKKKYSNNNDIKSIFNIKIDNNILNDNYNDKNRRLSSTKTSNTLQSQKNKKSKQKNIDSLIGASNSSKKLKNMNNSSYNNLVESFSQFLKEKMNNSINASKELLTNSKNTNNFSNQNMINSTNSLSKHNLNIQNNKNFTKKENENDEQEKFQDILLNKSNKSIILIIKIFIIIMAILIVLIIIFNFYKFNSSLTFSSKYDSFFQNFAVLTNRYSILFYFYNHLRTLFIFPEVDNKKYFSASLDMMTTLYDSQTKIFNGILLSQINNYHEIKDLFNIITDNRNNLTEYLKENICGDIKGCRNYLDSEYNIFSSGIDLALKTCITQINNIYMDYKNLKNRTDLNEINITLIQNPHFKFSYIGNSINNMFIYVKEKIFECFKNDITTFNNSYDKRMKIFNAISIIFSVFLFLFVIIVIFVSISKFTEPIKHSTYRINLSFFYIKKYSLNNYRKNNSFIIDYK